jgi:Ca2+-binding EF-hand superfamily protein
MQAPTKEEMLKRVTDPQMVPNAVNKFFTELDPENTGFITVDAFLVKSREFGEKLNAPKSEAQQKGFADLVAKNSADGKLTRDNLKTIMELFFQNVAAYIKSLP